MIRGRIAVPNVDPKTWRSGGRKKRKQTSHRVGDRHASTDEETAGSAGSVMRSEGHGRALNPYWEGRHGDVA